ncbi:MAG: 50S ribosomal protein L11 methyltransferase [Myxococcales bacterium]|nr:50S ribosomal protein L11 methyltransferase [Myxococcales bacterium]
MSDPVYPFLAIDVPASLAEVAADQLFELGAEGVERRDASTLVRGAHSAGPILDPGADVASPRAPVETEDEVVTLVAAFPTREAAEEALAAFDAELSPRIEEVHGDAWRDAWKEHFEPFLLTPHVMIRPPWRPVPTDLAAGVHVLELEPGRAFGTGLHATTALVSRVLDARAAELEGREILDLGCGSGILSLVALVLGAARADALDIDPAAVEVTRANAERCGLADRIAASDEDFAGLTRTYPIVLANIQAEVLVPRAADVKRTVAPGGLLVLSGILAVQREEVLAQYAELRLEEAPAEGEWIALVLRAGP